MPVVIDELSTKLQVEDEGRVRDLVREEIQRELSARGLDHGGRSGADPTDPGAAGHSGEGSGG